MIYQNDRRFIFMNKNAAEKNLFFCSLKGLGVSAVLSLLLSASMCMIGLLLDDPDKYTKIFAMASLFFSAFAGGFASARAKGSGTLLCGLCTGIMIIAVITLTSLGFALPVNLPLFCICAPCVIAACILGANIGVGTRSSKKKKKR